MFDGIFPSAFGINVPGSNISISVSVIASPVATLPANVLNKSTTSESCCVNSEKFIFKPILLASSCRNLIILFFCGLVSVAYSEDIIPISSANLSSFCSSGVLSYFAANSSILLARGLFLGNAFLTDLIIFSASLAASAFVLILLSKVA